MVVVHTLLTSKSSCVKCRPYSSGVDPGRGSILMHTSSPARALSLGL